MYIEREQSCGIGLDVPFEILESTASDPGPNIIYFDFGVGLKSKIESDRAVM